MPSKKRGLGRGLEALLPVEAMPEGTSEVAVSLIRRNPRQPRGAMAEGELEELAASIREHGVLQPLVVTAGQVPGEFTLIAGERRLEAARRAGLEKVPVVVRAASEQERLLLALIENVQRADLSPLETAEAYRQLNDEFGLSHEDISKRVAKSRVAVTNTLRLLRLPEAVRRSLTSGQLTEGHARALLALPTLHAQAAAADTVIRKGLNVRQTEELVRRLLGKHTARPTPPKLPPDLRALQRRLQEAFGTRIDLRRAKRGGTLIFHFYSDEELDALAEHLLKAG
jgi:ParB family transcriptional regulator, chromosome partitioning protein